MKNIILILTAFILTVNAFAQNNEAKTYNTTISLVPQYTIVNGFRLDIDKPVSKDHLQWISFSPQVYVSWQSNLTNYDQMWGLGMDIKHRIYLNKEVIKPKGLYFQYGPGFQFFSIDDVREYSESFLEDGIEYWRVASGSLNTKVYKVGGNIHLGYQSMIGDKVLVDFYLGSGIRLSFDNRNDGLHPWFNSWWGSPGYSGTLLDAGLRIGIAY
jgi:hypothetical protein